MIFRSGTDEIKIVRKADICVIEDEPEWDGPSMCLLTLVAGVQLNVKGRAQLILKQLEQENT